MSRFSYGVTGGGNPKKRMFLSLGFFVALFFFFLYATGSLASGNAERQKESLTNALNKSIIYHYATNGSYPVSLEQIEELYGITYDKDAFFIDYVVRGSNIMPEVTIIVKEEQ